MNKLIALILVGFGVNNAYADGLDRCLMASASSHSCNLVVKIADSAISAVYSNGRFQAGERTAITTYGRKELTNKTCMGSSDFIPVVGMSSSGLYTVHLSSIDNPDQLCLTIHYDDAIYKNNKIVGTVHTWSNFSEVGPVTLGTVQKDAGVFVGVAQFKK